MVIVVASQASGAGIAGGNPEEISGGQQGTDTFFSAGTESGIRGSEDDH